MTINGREIILVTSGMGIVFYSPKWASHIEEGADYFTSHYATEQQVQSHIQSGTIVGFMTGSPGRYILAFHAGYPDETYVQNCRFKLRLGLNCAGGIVCFRDLFDLIQWDPNCPLDQTLRIEDGCYHVTLCSEMPTSGSLGDDQIINIYLAKLEAFPRLAKQGIPTLCM
jgi:hypothetical protein